MRGNRIRAATKISLALALLGLVTPTVTAAAQPAQTIQTRTVVLPLSGTFDEPDAEPINITGSIRVTVITQTNPGGGGTARIVSNLRRTTGVGEETGDTYRFAGADVATRAYPPDPITPLEITPVFLKFWPPGPVLPPNPVRPVEIVVSVAGNGAITDISAEVADDAGPET
ncbi:hypothetical protein SSP24_44620 [Streptomyces spinoverrucosus]|uniref:Uncharacterized protein n=1 Tax=Streptomyces spinoverrucosus TaxID=284043 RepID=A0A4Y3VIX6_9ACTN|nr:hypothetical protein [Streptomyces spinoverrucosus]GEC06807.1 hypothetical protein SSP24_44620 [Streptomyces spinoverrucosus]GHB80238.1 hypothetical protein GCM10010397_58730 [Streptomyces spinoverrucosus]